VILLAKYVLNHGPPEPSVVDAGHECIIDLECANRCVHIIPSCFRGSLIVTRSLATDVLLSTFFTYYHYVWDVTTHCDLQMLTCHRKLGIHGVLTEFSDKWIDYF
jgi:hypothetical protein